MLWRHLINVYLRFVVPSVEGISILTQNRPRVHDTISFWRIGCQRNIKQQPLIVADWPTDCQPEWRIALAFWGGSALDRQTRRQTTNKARHPRTLSRRWARDKGLTIPHLQGGHMRPCHRGGLLAAPGFGPDLEGVSLRKSGKAHNIWRGHVMCVATSHRARPASCCFPSHCRLRESQFSAAAEPTVPPLPFLRSLPHKCFSLS